MPMPLTRTSRVARPATWRESLREKSVALSNINLVSGFW